MAKTQKYNTTSSRITKQKIASSKGLQLICALLTLVLDATVLVMLFNNTVEFKFLLCPILLLVIDLAFLIKVIFSNYRFSYAIKGIIVHIASVVLVCGYAILSTEILDGRIVFATFALYAMPAVHLIQCLASVINAFHAANKGKLLQRIAAICMTLVFAVGAVIYGYFVLQNGFFGQSNKRIQRTIVYELDDSENYYIVNDVLKGFGNTVVIPETFNGLPIGGVNCKLFSNEQLAYIVFDCNPDIDFLNSDDLNKANEKLKLETSKSNLDKLRENIFSLAIENPELISIANSITPYDIKGNQVFITFCYDKDSLKTANGSILPRSKGTDLPMENAIPFTSTPDDEIEIMGIKYLKK